MCFWLPLFGVNLQVIFLSFIGKETFIFYDLIFVFVNIIYFSVHESYLYDSKASRTLQGLSRMLHALLLENLFVFC